MFWSCIYCNFKKQIQFYFNSTSVDLWISRYRWSELSCLLFPWLLMKVLTWLSVSILTKLESGDSQVSFYNANVSLRLQSLLFPPPAATEHSFSGGAWWSCQLFKWAFYLVKSEENGLLRNTNECQVTEGILGGLGPALFVISHFLQFDNHQDDLWYWPNRLTRKRRKNTKIIKIFMKKISF